MEETAAEARAWLQLAIDKESSDGFIAGHGVELFPRAIIGHCTDIILADQLTAPEVRTFHSDCIKDLHHYGLALTRHHAHLMVELRRLAELDADIGGDAISAEGVAAFELY